MKFAKSLNKKEITTEIIKYLFSFFVFYIVSKANINGLIYPFSFGILFALMWCNNNVLILAPLYIAGTFLGTFNLVSLYCAIGTVVVMLITYGIHFKLKKRIKYWQLGLYGLASQIPYVVLSIFSQVSIVISVLFIFRFASSILWN